VPLPGLPPIHHSIVRLRELLERFTAVLLGFLASATFVLCRLQKEVQLSDLLMFFKRIF